MHKSLILTILCLSVIFTFIKTASNGTKTTIGYICDTGTLSGDIAQCSSIPYTGVMFTTGTLTEQMDATKARGTGQGASKTKFMMN